MRRPSFHRSLARLALLAVLLLAFAPSVSRWLAASVGPMCVHSAQGLAAFGADGHAPAAPGEAGDCGYCALVGGMAPVATVAWLPVAVVPHAGVLVPASRGVAGPRAGTLGARGPPALRQA